MIIQLGRDGLKKPTKKRKTKRPASKTISAVSGAPETTNYMRAIQTPSIPTLVTGLSIRSQADLQEQLRIKQTTEREDVKLYPTPAPASFKRRLEDEELVQQELVPAPAEEVKQAEEPEPMMDFPRMPLMRKEELLSPPPRAPPRLTPQSSLASLAEEEEEFIGYFGGLQQERADLPTPPPAPRRRRGRPASDFKTILTLRKEIRAKVSPAPFGLASMSKDELQAEAMRAGIDIMK